MLKICIPKFRVRRWDYIISVIEITKNRNSAVIVSWNSEFDLKKKILENTRIY